MIPLLVVLPVTVEGNREEMCEPRHTSLLVQKMQGRAEVSCLADANSRGMQRPTSAYGLILFGFAVAVGRAGPPWRLGNCPPTVAKPLPCGIGQPARRGL